MLWIHCVVMMSITVEDYETQYWPKLEHAIQHLLTTKPSEYIPISYEQMYTYVAAPVYSSINDINSKLSKNSLVRSHSQTNISWVFSRNVLSRLHLTVKPAKSCRFVGWWLQMIYRYWIPSSAKSIDSRECRTVSLVLFCSVESRVVPASTGIVTLASTFLSNRLQAGNLGIQNTVNIPTDISSSTYPPPVHRLFSVTRDSLRSSQRPLLHLQQTRAANGSRTFSVAIPNTWNKLPADVLAANSLNVFHRRLKTHFFTAAFGDKYL